MADPQTARTLREKAIDAEAAITGTMLAHMPVPEAAAVVRLKAAVQNLTAALAQPDATTTLAQIVDNLEVLYNTIGDLRYGFGRAVDPERWTRDTQVYLRQQINRLMLAQPDAGEAKPVDAPPALGKDEWTALADACEVAAEKAANTALLRALEAKCRAHAEGRT